jgi:UDP-glucose 6-dehydrogenase
MLKLSKLQRFILLNPTKRFTKLFTYVSAGAFCPKIAQHLMGIERKADCRLGTYVQTDTDDVRNSVAVDLINDLIREGAD